jgi:hypothetical protein
MEGGDVAFIRPGIFHTGCCSVGIMHVTHMNGWIRVCVSSAVAVDWDSSSGVVCVLWWGFSLLVNLHYVHLAFAITPLLSLSPPVPLFSLGHPQGITWSA